MEIFSATPDDASVFAALECQSFAEPWKGSTLDAALRDEKYIFLLARENETVIAYAIGWNVGEEAELARIGVLPSWRGQGIGELLTHAILKAFRERDIRSVFLEVRESNLAARKLYEKCGFAEVGKRADYYADGETAIVLRANL